MEGEVSVPLSDQILEEIEARCSACVPGPWTSYVEGRDHTSGSSFIKTGTVDGRRGEDIELFGVTEKEQDFIAHARQDIPLLVAEVRRLKGILGRI
jgi:hypothetical protein